MENNEKLIRTLMMVEHRTYASTVLYIARKKLNLTAMQIYEKTGIFTKILFGWEKNVHKTSQINLIKEKGLFDFYKLEVEEVYDPNIIPELRTQSNVPIKMKNILEKNPEASCKEIISELGINPKVFYKWIKPVKAQLELEKNSPSLSEEEMINILKKFYFEEEKYPLRMAKLYFITGTSQITKSDAAKALNTSRQLIDAIFRGKQQASEELLVSLEKLYNHSILEALNCYE